MFGTFDVLKKHFNFKVYRDSPSIDNIIFKLHYRATFLILLACVILVSSRQYIGEHIRCVSDNGVPDGVMESFCFFMSTFTVVKHMNVTAVEEGEIPHFGVGPKAKGDEVTRHAYYQWVPFVLFLQALLFYLPHYFWRSVEGGRLAALTSGLQMAAISLRDDKLVTDNAVVPSRKDKELKIQQIRTAFMNRLHLNRPWAYYLGLCELMNFFNVVGQMYITNRFLGGAFLDLGHGAIEATYDKLKNPLDEVFPKVTKCTFHKYGPSGNIQTHDALCVMALNIINEKIYTFLWFWFIILASFSLLGLVWRILTMIMHSRYNFWVRIQVNVCNGDAVSIAYGVGTAGLAARHMSTFFNKWVFAMACPGRYNPWDVLKVTNEYYFGDWLFLYYIAKNVENYVFKELLQGLALDLEDRRRAMYRGLAQDDPLKGSEYKAKDAEAQGDDNSKMLLMS